MPATATAATLDTPLALDDFHAITARLAKHTNDLVAEHGVTVEVASAIVLRAFTSEWPEVAAALVRTSNLLNEAGF